MLQLKPRHKQTNQPNATNLVDQNLPNHARREVNTVRTRYRKTSIVRAIDLRDRRQRAGLTADRMADYLEVADSKHVSSIELGKCTLTMEKAVRAAYVLGGVTVELPGLGMAAVVPITDCDGGAAPTRSDLRPGEAAWIALQETREAIDYIPCIQEAVTKHDREALVRICEQVVCDPHHAVELLADAISTIDPTVMAEAAVRHAQKLMARGIRTVARIPWQAQPPLDVA